MIKDPDATLDFGIDWSGWLAPGESIATSTWLVSGSGLTIGTASYAPTQSPTATKVWLTGGTIGARYRVTNRITTDSVPPRIDDRSFDVSVRER